MTDSEATIAKDSILSEPNCDFVYDETLPAMDGLQLFAVESLPGQYDQRADSAAQCVQLLTQKERPVFRTATVYAFDEAIPRPSPPSISTKSKSISSIPSKPARPLWTSPNHLK